MNRAPRRSSVALALFCSFALACGDSPSDEAASPERRAAALAAAEAACDELGRRLLEELSDALTEGSTLDALEVCSAKAPAIGTAVRRETGVVVARTSLRVRNLDNMPDEFERAHLERWRQAALAGEAPQPVVEVVPVGSGADLHYLRPIRTVELCSRCHGPTRTLEPEVRAALARLYPADQATGYAPGDLRGAFTARVPLGR